LETEIDRIRGELKKLDDGMEQMEQTLRLLRDEIEETDETIFGMQKERDEKERLKSEILARKQEEEKEEEKRQPDNESEGESDLDDSDYEETIEDIKHEDKMRYKILLRDYLKQKTEDIMLGLAIKE
jgi:chromosome segregation ATPase